MSGLPPAYGLSTAAVAGLVAALFGKSAQVVTGPTNTTGLLILAALAPHLGAERPPRAKAACRCSPRSRSWPGPSASSVALAGGAHLIRFLPESVLVGFTAGAGLLIAAHAARRGARPRRRPARAASCPSCGGRSGRSPSLAVPALLVTVATVALVPLGRRLSPRLPAALVAVLRRRAASRWLSGLSQASGLPLVRDRAGVPSGLAARRAGPASTRGCSSSCSCRPRPSCCWAGSSSRSPRGPAARGPT